MNPGPRRRLSAVEYQRRQQARQAQEEKEAEAWTQELEDDGSTEVLLLYFGIATVLAGLLGLYYTHSMYMAAQPASDSQQ